MCREIVSLTMNDETGELEEISSYSVMVDALCAYRDSLIVKEDLTGLERDKLTMLNLMIEDAIDQTKGS